MPSHEPSTGIIERESPLNSASLLGRFSRRRYHFLKDYGASSKLHANVCKHGLVSSCQRPRRLFPRDEKSATPTAPHSIYNNLPSERARERERERRDRGVWSPQAKKTTRNRLVDDRTMANRRKLRHGRPALNRARRERRATWPT